MLRENLTQNSIVHSDIDQKSEFYFFLSKTIDPYDLKYETQRQL